MRNNCPAPLPLPGFFFEGAAIFTSAAENIGNLWNEACKHGLEAGRRTHTETHIHIRPQRRTRISHCNIHQHRRQTCKARRYDVTYTNMAVVSGSGFTSCRAVCCKLRCTCCESRVYP